MNIDLNQYFGDYKHTNVKILNQYISILDNKVSKYYNFGKPFFKGEHKFNYKEYLTGRTLNYNPLTAEEVFEYISPLYQNLPNWNNPGTMINVIPPVNLVSMASMSFSELYNPNLAQDTYAGLLITAELEVSKYIADLVKWDWKQSLGVFTFGGKGTNLYATKISLAKACPETKELGCERNKYFMITSENGHPCHYEVCNWLGIGKNSCIDVKCNVDGRINVQETEKIICNNIEQGKIFLGFNLNGGSTNELTIDPIREIFKMNQKIVNKYKLNYTPHIHVDSVLGWVYLFFNDYDYTNNSLGIEKEQLEKIQSLSQKVQEFKYADSLGIDFHKTGFCPYTSSLFIVKNRKDFYNLGEIKEIPLEELQYGKYNPYETTLELTRPSSGPIMALTTLKSLGISGFQQIIANMFKSTERFRNILKQNENVCIINENAQWLTTLFILKPKEYKNLSLSQILNLGAEAIQKIKEYNVNYAKYILEKGKNGEISFTFTASRSYKIPNTNIKLGALKAYPMSVFLNENEVVKLVKDIVNTIEDYEDKLNYIDYEKLDTINDNMVYKEKK